MPRGKYVNHKGRSRCFRSPEEVEKELREAEKKKQRAAKNADDGSSEDESENDSNSDSDTDESEDENKKCKGVSNLIEIENPNRIKKKDTSKVTNISLDGAKPKTELTRREREEIEKQKAHLNYQKMHAEGKTEQARNDLARLAIIKMHRAEAAERREKEKKEKEEKRRAGTSTR